MEEGPVFGPTAPKEAEPANPDLSADCRTILGRIFGGIDGFAVRDGVNNINEETLEGEGGIGGVTVGTERLKDFGTPFGDFGRGTPGIVALAVDAFAAGAMGRIACTMSFLVLLGGE
jgi:hypothetical protein